MFKILSEIKMVLLFLLRKQNTASSLPCLGHVCVVLGFNLQTVYFWKATSEEVNKQVWKNNNSHVGNNIRPL